MTRTGSELIIDYVDELARGRSRIDSVIGGIMDDGLQGLARTILSAIVRAASPPTVPQIGRSLGYPRQTVLRHVEALADAGLVTLIDNPDHKTAKRLVPTERGKAIYDCRNQASMAWAETFAEEFNRADLETMVATMRAIRARLEALAREREHL
ncbi:MAG: MarR family transcriptional regulator [Novosphingobium sp.]|nr:MarR family transcriptional regulator [Novosphingobium sp.]